MAVTFAEWAGSGMLVGANAATFGFAADVPNAIATSAIQKPRGGTGTLNIKLSLFVTSNTFVATTTRFEIYRNGVATGNFIDVAAGASGATVTLTVALAFATGERFDLSVSNPGGAPEVGKTISFGWSAAFY